MDPTQWKMGLTQRQTRGGRAPGGSGSAAVAVGVAGVFIEVHDDPDNAASDGPNNLHLKDLESLLIKLKQFDTISKSV